MDKYLLHLLGGLNVAAQSKVNRDHRMHKES